MNWIIDEYGNEQFTHHTGWAITIYPANGHVGCPIYVRHETQDCDVQVEMVDGEITVYAERHHGGYEGPSPQRVYIPVAVMRAIIEAYDTVQARTSTA